MNLWLIAVQMNLLEKLMMKKHFINASLSYETMKKIWLLLTLAVTEFYFR